MAAGAILAREVGTSILQRAAIATVKAYSSSKARALAKPAQQVIKGIAATLGISGESHS